MIRFECPGCQARYTVPADKAGKVTRCSRCRAKFFVPTPPASPPPVPPVPELVETSFPDPQPFVTQVEQTDIEIAPCPGCQARLMVSAAELGNEVECPYCKAVYTAATATARRVVEPEPEALPYAEVAEERPRRRRRDEDEDEEDEEDEEEPPIRRRKGGRRKPAKRQSGASRFVVTLAALSALSSLLLLVSLVAWPVAIVAAVIGYGMAFVGGIWFLVVAFQESAVQGVLNLLVPFYSLFYLVTRFEEEAKPFVFQLVGLVIFSLGCVIAIAATAPR